MGGGVDVGKRRWCWGGKEWGLERPMGHHGYLSHAILNTNLQCFSVLYEKKTSISLDVFLLGSISCRLANILKEM